MAVASTSRTRVRNEIEIVADALWVLIDTGLVSRRPDVIARACGLLGIAMDDLRSAKARSDMPGARYPMPRPRPVAAEDSLDVASPPPPPPPPPPTPSPPPLPPRSSGSTRQRKPRDPLARAPRLPDEKRCSLCGQTKPLTTDHFNFRTDRPGQFRPECRDCGVASARTRYLNVRASAALQRVGLRFVLTEDDRLGELVCSRCDQPLRVGDTVEVSGRPSHAGHCPTPRSS